MTDAAVARIVPLGGDFWNEHISIAGTDVQRKNANFNRVGPGYFQAMGTTLLAGRDFEDRDGPESSPSRSSRRRSRANSWPARARSGAASRWTTWTA